MQRAMTQPIKEQNFFSGLLIDSTEAICYIGVSQLTMLLKQKAGIFRLALQELKLLVCSKAEQIHSRLRN